MEMHIPDDVRSDVKKVIEYCREHAATFVTSIEAFQPNEGDFVRAIKYAAEQGVIVHVFPRIERPRETQTVGELA